MTEKPSVAAHAVDHLQQCLASADLVDAAFAAADAGVFPRASRFRLCLMLTGLVPEQPKVVLSSIDK